MISDFAFLQHSKTADTFQVYFIYVKTCRLGADYNLRTLLGGLTDPTSCRMAIVRSQKCRKIFFLERLLGRTILDFLNIRLIFLEARLRRKQTGGGPAGEKKIKVRTLNSVPVFGKVLEEYYRSTMDRLIEKLAYVYSIEEKDWI
jgi:hypothetical protein